MKLKRLQKMSCGRVNVERWKTWAVAGWRSKRWNNELWRGEGEQKKKITLWYGQGEHLKKWAVAGWRGKGEKYELWQGETEQMKKLAVARWRWKGEHKSAVAGGQDEKANKHILSGLFVWGDPEGPYHARGHARELTCNRVGATSCKALKTSWHLSSLFNQEGNWSKCARLPVGALSRRFPPMSAHIASREEVKITRMLVY